MNKNFKKIIATVAALAMAASSFVAMAATYPDVTPDASYYSAVEQLSALGMIEGFDDGTFKADEKVTRAQMAKLVVGAKNLLAAAESNTTQKFDDVKADHWAVGYVAEGVAQGIINGTSDTTFDPEATVTFAQATKMLVNACGYDEYAQIAGGWPNGYLTWGSELGINKGVTGVSNDTELTRGQVAQMIANAIKAPILKVAKYTVDNGVRVPEYKQMNGEDGNKFESLLTNEWDTYEVYGRVDGTNRDGGTDAGEVDYQVEKSDNYNGAKYTGKVVATTPSTVYDVADVNGAQALNSGAENYYLEYTYALIQLNDDDEATIVYIESAGKNEVVEFNANLYASCADPAATATPSISLYKSESTTSTKSYNLDPNVKLIVNGVVINSGALSATNVSTYLDKTNNVYENAYLIDSPKAGVASTDGNYDYITVDCYKTAVVSEVIAKASGTAKVVFDVQQAGVSALEYDPEDETKTFSFALTDGTELEITDLKANDVLSIQANPLNFAGSSFYNVIVSRDTAEGKATGSGTDANGATVYTIGDGEYKFALGMTDTINMLSSYTLYLDKDGNIAKRELLATSVNYAIVDRFYSTAGETKVRLVLKDGSKVDYAVKADTTGLKNKMAVNATYPLIETGDFDSNPLTPNTTRLVAADAFTYTDANSNSTYDAGDTITGYTAIAGASRFVEYTVNSAGEVTLSAIATNKVEVSDTYDARAERIGSYGVSDTSVILNAEEFATDTTKSVAVIEKTGLVDDMDYLAVFLGERNKTDGSYPMVVMLTGNTGYTTSSRIQVATGATKSITEDGENLTAIPVIAEDGTKADLVLATGAVIKDAAGSTLTTAAIKEGVPFVASTNTNGEADEITILLADTALASVDTVYNAMSTTTTGGVISESLTIKGESAGKQVEFILAPVVKKYASGLALAAKSAAISERVETGSGTSYVHGAKESNDTGELFSYAANAKAVAFDGSVRAGSKVSALETVNEVIQSTITSAGKDAAGTKIEWYVDKTDGTATDYKLNTNNTVAFALIRVFDGDVQEVYSISFE